VLLRYFSTPRDEQCRGLRDTIVTTPLMLQIERQYHQ
jgi:hypothetical protein